MPIADDHPRTAHAGYDEGRQSLVIRHIEITDPGVLAELPHWTNGVRGPAASSAALANADLSAFCQHAIVAGSAAIRAASGAQLGAQLEHVIQEVGRRASEVAIEATATTNAASARATDAMIKATETAQRSLLDANRSTRENLSAQVDRAVNMVKQEVQRLVGGDDPVLATKLAALLADFGTGLDARISARTDELYAKAARQLDPRDPTSPLAEFTSGLGRQQSALTAHLEAGQRAIAASLDKLTEVVTASQAAHTAAAAVRSISPLKGGDFQEQVHECMSGLAAATGDDYQDTSSTQGLIARCRKGDGLFLINLPGGIGEAKIVIEVTDSDTARRQWNDYLDEAERNRDAHASLGIVRTVAQMPRGELLRTYGPRRIVLAHDPSTDAPDLLYAAMHLLRNQAVLAATRVGNDSLHTVEEKLDEATDCLAKLADIQRAAGTIRKGADKIDSDCASLHTTLQRLLAEATAALAGAENGGTVSAA